MKERALSIISHLFVIVPVFGTVSLATFWLSDRQPAVHIDRAWVTPRPAVPGTDYVVNYELRFRDDACKYTVLSQLVDGEGIRHQYPSREYYTGETIVNDNGRTSSRGARPVPPSARSGSGFYRAVFVTVCNPLHHWWPITSEIIIPLEIK